MILGKSKVWLQCRTSLAITIPKVVRENLGVRQGDVIVFKLVDGKIVIEKEEKK